MGKFGGFGGFSASGLVSKATSAASKAINKVESMPQDKLMGYMEKATIGNAASWVGGKIGLNLDAGKIDGVINRYTDMKSKIGGMMIDTVLNAASAAGYQINLPDGEKIANYIMNNTDIMNNIESLGDQITEKGLKNVIKDIDIPKIADELGASVTKIPTPKNTEEVNSAISGVSSSALKSAGDVGKVVGTGVVNIGTEVGTAIKDVEQIVTNKEGE